jgi:hypothetical protein
MENQKPQDEAQSEAALAAPTGSANLLCPFCKQPCDAGWDCACGAKAVNSVMWFYPSKPLMRHANIGEMGLVMRVMAQTLDEGLREMLHSTNDQAEL